ncbi:MAG: hypothetical protein IT330_12445 [Anaerolineae bacterium]|nr:hypothetical protein [Anaerolineae bacterium]
MTTSSSQPNEGKPRDATYWAQPVSRLKVSGVPSEAINLNVDGRRVMSPLQGFGQMWQKNYRIRLAGTKSIPAEVIKTWKENFQKFWPPGNRFYAPLTSISPGEVAVLNLSGPGGIKLSTGIMVIYADDESFTFMTPEGHMFSGWITFSAHTEDSHTVAQAQVLIRANDPLYEIAFRMGGSRQEDQFWVQTLTSLAAHFGAEGEVEMQATCVDPKLQWSQAKNIWHNAAIRTVLNTPVRLARSLFRRNAINTR